VVAVHAGEQLVGLAPFYSSRRLGVIELRLLSGGFASRLGVLARPGHEREAAAAIVRALTDAGLVPDVFRLEAVDAASPWLGWLSASWPDGRGYHLQEISELSAPLLHLPQGSFDEWFAERSAHFRRNMRRDRRQIEKKGAHFRRADRDSLEHDLAAFGRLHAARREGRGSSHAATPAAMAALREAGEKLIDSSRFRLWMIDGPDGDPISAHLFVEAGGTVAFWNTGFDERWGKHSPGAVGLLAAIEDAFERGDRLIDMGGGEASYKRRLADDDRPVAWRTSYRLGARYPLARLRRLPEQVARRGSSKLRERPVAHRVMRFGQLLKH
jgi:CelD/BcsL family acetyltransferase involved in cellulose biosynthesis